MKIKTTITAITLATMLAFSSSAHAAWWDSLADASAWCDATVTVFTFGQVRTC